MTEHEILEGNKLIAEFDGAIFTNDDTEVYPQGYLYFNDIGALEAKNLMYNDSWDWLMPILDKIEKMGCIVEISFSLVVFCRICAIGKKEDRATNFIADNNGGLEPIVPVYKAVVEFIKWHNNQVK